MNACTMNLGTLLLHDYRTDIHSPDDKDDDDDNNDSDDSDNSDSSASNGREIARRIVLCLSCAQNRKTVRHTDVIPGI